ncbi:MAG: hypothetical protein HOO67_00085 [Candidatus Peribacteraceae bacterium]|nr:hypothetical protein [Candidatus Peribacteraceae bacterium]
MISGSGRGRTLRVPTLNLDLRDVPHDLQDGVFACRAIIDGKTFPSSMHKGSRPTFGDTPSCEVHIIDEVIATPPETLKVEVVQFLRGILKFPSAEALSGQMLEDNRMASDILAA